MLIPLSSISPDDVELDIKPDKPDLGDRHSTLDCGQATDLQVSNTVIMSGS